MLNCAVENASNSLKDIQRAGALQNEADKKKADTGKKPAPAPARDNKSAGGKNTKTGSASVLPNTIEQWSQFELSEEIISAWSHELMKRTGINRSTIVEPYMIFHHLHTLSEMLGELGFAQLQLPVLNLQLIVVNSVLKADMEQAQLVSLNSYLRYQMINLCVEMNLLSAVGFHQQALTLLVSPPTDPAVPQSSTPATLLKLLQIDPFDVCVVREQLFNLKQRLSQLDEEESSLVEKSSSSIGSNPRKEPINNTKSKKNTQTKGNTVSMAIDGEARKSKDRKLAHDLNLPGEHRRVHNNLHDSLYKDVWILMAESLVQNGHMQTARDFLHESLNASVVRRLFYLQI